MNSKPFKPCNAFGCGNLTQSRYCEQHTTVQRDNNRYYDKHRNKEHVSFYNSKAWRKTRQLAIQQSNGLCVKCLAQEKIVLGRVVDHIIPVRQDWSKRFDLDNLQYLCQACHNAKTAKENK